MMDQVGQITAAIDRIHPTWRKQAPFDGKRENQEQPKPEGWHGNTDENREGEPLVGPAILLHRRDDTSQQAENGTKHKRGPSQNEGRGKTLQHFIKNGSVERVGAAKIPLKHVAQPDEILLHHRLVEAQILIELGNILRRGKWAKDRQSGIAGDQRHDDENNNG